MGKPLLQSLKIVYNGRYTRSAGICQDFTGTLPVKYRDRPVKKI